MNISNYLRKRHRKALSLHRTSQRSKSSAVMTRRNRNVDAEKTKERP